MNYIPRQRDIVWIDFDPSRGKEIRKRRPAVVISRSAYNSATYYCIVCPITSSRIRENPSYYSLNNYKTKGQVVTLQVMTLDFSKQAGREIQYIETMNEEDFSQIAQRVQNNFGFNL